MNVKWDDNQKRIWLQSPESLWGGGAVMKNFGHFTIVILQKGQKLVTV